MLVRWLLAKRTTLRCKRSLLRIKKQSTIEIDSMLESIEVLLQEERQLMIDIRTRDDLIAYN